MGPIQEFFSSKTVLVTGATGFLGGVLLEKLLSSSPGLLEVLVVVRTRKGQTPEDRLQRLLALPLFDNLSEDAKNKVHVVPGDVSLPELGLTLENQQRIKETVNVVFHVAANINFSSPLDKAVITNVGGTDSILSLSKEIKNLKVLIYVSTAYCNCTEKRLIEEKVYPIKWDPVELLRGVKTLPSEDINRRTKEYIGEHPNTYSFTKQLAENLLANERGDVPVAIVRPSIVLNTASKPFPGWTYNVQSGAFAFIAGAFRGAFRTACADGEAIADLVPSDYFTSFLMASAWNTAIQRGLQVYHYTSGTVKPIRWSGYVTSVMKNIKDHPVENAMLLPKAKCRKNFFHIWFFALLFHLIPAWFFDISGKALGLPFSLVQVQKKYSRGMEYASYFTCNQWLFSPKNSMELWSKMTREDKDEFWFDMKQFDWDIYIKTCVLGVRRYYHNQEMCNLQSAKTRHFLLKVYYYSAWFLFYLALTYFLSLFTSSTELSLLYGFIITSFLFWI